MSKCEKTDAVATTDDLDAMLTPQVFDLPASWGPTKKSVVGLACFNIPVKDIAKQLSLTEGSVRGILADTQVKAITAKGEVIRKMFMSSMAQVIYMRLLGDVKLKEFNDLDLEKRVKLAKQCVEIVQSLNVKPMKEEKDDRALVDELKADAENSGDSEDTDESGENPVGGCED